MNILQVDNIDIVGGIFNGHSLSKSLNQLGFHCCQVVKSKLGDDENTIPLGQTFVNNAEASLIALERELSMNAMLGVWDRYLEASVEFKEANIVHYHKIHNGIITLPRFRELVNKKPSVWTIHDPWAITGHCVHPLECNQWKTGCEECQSLREYFPLKQQKSAHLWAVKKDVYKNMDIDIIVSSLFMEDFIKKSPLTRHLSRIHRIPFGVHLEQYNNSSKSEIRREWGLDNHSVVIGFRNDDYHIKGSSYIIDAMTKLVGNSFVGVCTVGNVYLPEQIRNHFHCVELGWQNDPKMVQKFYAACDIFIMPSLAESFGMMAIEAMASGCTVIAFQDTVLESLIESPECGIAVEYKSSEAILKELMRLIHNPDEIRVRGEKSRRLVEKKYDYNDYVKKHIDLYVDIINREGRR